MTNTSTPDAADRGPQPRTTPPTDQERLKTLFDLGRQVAAVLDLDDVLTEPRYVETVPGTRSALVVPLRRKGKTLGALNLQSAMPGRFTETDEAVLTSFAAAVAVAIENARHFEQEKQYAEMLETLARIGREVASILDLDELLTSIAQHLRSVINYRTFGILLKRRTVALANSGLPYPILSVGDTCEAIELGGVPLGSFAGSSYDDLHLDLHGGDLFVFYTDGVPEALDAEGREFGTARLLETVRSARNRKAQDVVDAIFEAVQAFRGNAPPSDDTTAVVVRLMI